MQMRAAFLLGRGGSGRVAVLSALPGALAAPDVHVLWSERDAGGGPVRHDGSVDLDRVLCRSLGSLTRIRPDLIIAEDFGLSTWQAIAYRGLRRRTRLLLWITRQPRGGRLVRFMMSRADGVLANAEVAEAVERLGIPAARIFPLVEPSDAHPSHDHAGFARNAEQAHRLVYAGDLTPQAGAADILVSAASWAEQHPARSVEIWWIGDGPLRGVLEAQPLPENVSQRFLGRLGAKETERALAHCGILLVPTLVDDRHPVLAEAMALGLPVLGSRRNREVRDWVREGQTGWLFDPLSPEQASAALAEALDTAPPRLDRMRAACRAKVAAMSPHGLAERLERAVAAVLRDTLAAGRAPVAAE